MRILIATGGGDHSEPALQMAAALAQATGSSLTVLTVVDSEASRPTAKAILSAAQLLLAERVDNSETRIRVGDVAEEIVEEADEGEYDLIIMGEKKAHRFWSRLRGTVRERVVHFVTVPVIVAKGPARPIRRVLLCDSSLKTKPALSDYAAHFVGQLPEPVEVTVLHVMSQISAGPGVSGKDLRAEAEELIEEGAPEGELLEHDIEVLDEAQANPRPKVRHGLVVDEIMAEAQEGDYDLIIIGAHQEEWWQRWLLTDVAEEITVRADRPVLVVH
jgi:nucleotide-binding universal stress UspA family protein